MQVAIEGCKVEGRRVVAVQFDGCRFAHIESGLSFLQSAALADRVRMVGTINPEHWVEIDPVFGSERWAELTASLDTSDELYQD